MVECVKTMEEWVNMQQKMIRQDTLPDILPHLVKSGNCFIMKFDNEQDMIMFLLRWM